MKGSEIKLARYMQGASKRFVIPVYQRNYEWKICFLGVASIEFMFQGGTKFRFFAGRKKSSIFGKLKSKAITFVQRENRNSDIWLSQICACDLSISRLIIVCFWLTEFLKIIFCLEKCSWKSCRIILF